MLASEKNKIGDPLLVASQATTDLCKGRVHKYLLISNGWLKRMMPCAGVLSEESALTWPKLALACGKPSEALEAAESACKLHPQSAALWSQAIALCSHKAGLHQVIFWHTA